jgi:hypothetical protein
MEVNMNKEEYVAQVYKSIWQELDKKVQSKYGKSIAQLFGEETQVIERTLSHLITEMMQREILPEDIKYDLATMYVETQTANSLNKDFEKLKDRYGEAMFLMALITTLSTNDFYTQLMWNLIEFLLIAKGYVKNKK